MSNYAVNVFNAVNGQFQFTITLKVKHFREHDGRQVKTHGGYSCIFANFPFLVFSSKCRADEQFSRRKGVLTCIQKMLQSKSFQPNTTKEAFFIADARFKPNGVDIWIDTASNIAGGTFWWLTGAKLGSGLYAYDKNEVADAAAS